jgi:hypothetical protein
MPNVPDTSKPRLLICRICWEPVELETSKNDENGRAIHEECNDRQLSAQKRSSSPTNLTEEAMRNGEEGFYLKPFLAGGIVRYDKCWNNRRH